MNVLDENIRQDQAEQLRRWRIKFRRLVVDIKHPGIKDPQVIPALQQLHRPTFFTHDQDYFRRKLLHPSYCLVWLDLFDGDAASFIRAFLRHPAFRTHALRMHVVARLHPGGHPLLEIASIATHEGSVDLNNQAHRNGRGSRLESQSPHSEWSRGLNSIYIPPKIRLVHTNAEKRRCSVGLNDHTGQSSAFP